jgi:hypothetical protein
MAHQAEFCRDHFGGEDVAAMAAGLSKTLWDVAHIVKLVEAHELKCAA